MARHPWLDPSPFFFAGGPVGCLLIHGFTGAPAEMRPMGEFLAAHGLTVSGILLPGHGTQVEDMERTTWRDWAGAAEEGLRQLQGRCPVVFVGGLSMGGLLTLYLGERYPVHGLIAMAAAIRVSSRLFPLVPIAKHFLRYVEKEPPEKSDYVDPETFGRLWSYEVYPTRSAHEMMKLMRQVRPRLRDIRALILIVQGDQDSLVPPASAQELYSAVSSASKELLMVHSGHCVTVDAERERVWRAALDFIRRHTPAEHRHHIAD
jgi:carboxylesterase